VAARRADENRKWQETTDCGRWKIAALFGE
jgi:hypothetical protein